jgi:hypothetical protein
MQHPFEGVIGAGQEKTRKKPTRRSMLGRMLGAVAALFGAGAVASAQAPRRRATTLAFGEEGGATTFALGEEGGWRVPRNRPPTTLALWEEGGPRVPSIPPGRRPTTLAYGEEGGATTYALGEEGGSATTYALEEEGGR